VYVLGRAERTFTRQLNDKETVDVYTNRKKILAVAAAI